MISIKVGQCWAESLLSPTWLLISYLDNNSEWQETSDEIRIVYAQTLKFSGKVDARPFITFFHSVVLIKSRSLHLRLDWNGLSTHAAP